MADLLGLSYPVLSDPGGRVAAEYGVYNLLGDGLATPSVFIIDREGTIRWRYVGRDIADRPASSRIIAELDRL